MPLLNYKHQCLEEHSESFTSRSKEVMIKINHKRSCILAKALNSLFKIVVEPIVNTCDCGTDESNDDFEDSSLVDF